jgi:hypothetical protein
MLTIQQVGNFGLIAIELRGREFIPAELRNPMLYSLFFVANINL